jgi:hypothetical protein
MTIAANGTVTLATPLPASSGGSVIAQIVNTQDGAVATGTTLIPYDDTIPQNTEGTEFMTLAITPTSATSKLRIDIVATGCYSSINQITYALFQDSTADALAATAQMNDNLNWQYTTNLVHTMTSGTTSETTFKVRIGGVTGGTYTFNGKSAARKYGGVSASSITITEYTA